MVAADDDLIDRARSGDPEAWRELYETLTGRLLVWLRTRPSGDAAYDADDLASETWLVAASSIADFTGDRDAFAGWLFGIARNHLSNARRRSERRNTSPVAIVDHPPVWGVQPASSGDVDALDWTRRVLATLPPREGEVLSCMEVVGLDAHQTAAALGISVTAVRVARHRGLARIRKATDVGRPTALSR